MVGCAALPLALGLGGFGGKSDLGDMIWKKELPGG